MEMVLFAVKAWAVVTILKPDVANGACTIPSVFENSDWYASTGEQLSFTNDTMSGIGVAIFGNAPLTDWSCQQQTLFESEGRLLFRSKGTVDVLDVDWYAYLCMEFTQVTNNSFIYYLRRGQEVNAGEYRVYVFPGDTQDYDTACDLSHPASLSDFVTIIRKDRASEAYIQCPTQLLGYFEFNYTDSADNQLCNDPNATELMNGCTDKSSLSFNIPCMGQSIVYADAEVHCVATVSVGNDVFIQLYNNQSTVDDSTTYRFSCMAISSDSTSATVVYNNCTDVMTSSSRALDHGGAVIGASVPLLPYVFCRK